MLILLTSWFTRAERSPAITLLILGNPVTRALDVCRHRLHIIRTVGWQRILHPRRRAIDSLGIRMAVPHPQQTWDAAWMSSETYPAISPKITRQRAADDPPRRHNVRGALEESQRPPPLPPVLLVVRRPLWIRPVASIAVIQKGAARGIAVTGIYRAVPYFFAILLMLLASHYSDAASAAPAPSQYSSSPASLSSAPTSCIRQLLVGLRLPRRRQEHVYAPPTAPSSPSSPNSSPPTSPAGITALVNSCGARKALLHRHLVQSACSKPAPATRRQGFS